jgi:hypothetical protein
MLCSRTGEAILRFPASNLVMCRVGMARRGTKSVAWPGHICRSKGHGTHNMGLHLQVAAAYAPTRAYPRHTVACMSVRQSSHRLAV